MAKEIERVESSVAVRKNKRLGRGAVNSGLTCECGVFAAMACGEWPTQRVSGLFGKIFVSHSEFESFSDIFAEKSFQFECKNCEMEKYFALFSLRV